MDRFSSVFGNKSEEEDEGTNLLARIKIAWMNEKGAPEVLNFEEKLVEEVLEKVAEKVITGYYPLLWIWSETRLIISNLIVGGTDNNNWEYI